MGEARRSEGFSTDAPRERAAHHYGKSYRDIVRAARGEFPAPPDFVALPNDEDEVRAVLDWCADVGAAAIPYGGGSCRSPCISLSTSSRLL